MVTIRDVAHEAGVSAATVSRTLNGDHRVSQDVRERVLAAVQELGYRPNRIARSLRRQTTETIGVMVSDIENPHFTRAVRAIEDAAYTRGYRVILCNTDETAEKQRAYLEMLAAEQVSGIILAPADPTDPTISQLLDMNIPVVAFDRNVNDERADAVFADNVRATRTATEHLLRLGRTNVAFVAGRPDIQTGVERLRGYQETVQARGLPATVVHGQFRLEIARAVTHRLLVEHPDLDGLIVANNLMAIGALQALREAGRSVPDDIAVVGIDDPPWAGLVSPPMTTLAQPTQEMAQSAFDLLLDRIANHRSRSRSLIFQFELRVRESSGEARTTRPRWTAGQGNTDGRTHRGPTQ